MQAMAHFPVMHEPISPYTLDYRGSKMVFKKSGRKWCYGDGAGRRCAPTFRQAVVQAKHEVDMRATYGHENPDGLGTLFIALLAAAAGGVGAYFYFRSRPITDPALVAQAKDNLAALTPGSKVGLTYTKDTPYTSITPAFTQGLAQFQSTLNTQVTSADLTRIQQTTGVAPPSFPVRTDGVLDRSTFDWLIYTQG